jgi:hypothetical protein
VFRGQIKNAKVITIYTSPSRNSNVIRQFLLKSIAHNPFILPFLEDLIPLQSPGGIAFSGAASSIPKNCQTNPFSADSFIPPLPPRSSKYPPGAAIQYFQK